MNSSSLISLARNGLWHSNPSLVRLLGLSPLLAITTTVVQALGLGLASFAVIMGTNISIAILRTRLTRALHVPALLVIIATLVTCIELLMQAFAYSIYHLLGIFIPLIATNCIVWDRAETFANRSSVSLAAYDGLVAGTGFISLLLLVGAVRETLGRGTLFAGMELLFGEPARSWLCHPFGTSFEMPLFALPPGGFIVIGLLIALKNTLDTRTLKNSSYNPPTATAENNLARTTDKID